MDLRNTAMEPLGKDEESLVREHLPMANYMVNDLLRRVPSYIQRDDLMSAAMLGLVQAVRAFDPTREAKFATFARVRVQGALLDELRSRDWASRGVRAKARSFDVASDELENALGRKPTAAELQRQLGTDAAQVHRLQADIHRATVLSLEGGAPDDSRTPLDVVAIHDEQGDPADLLAKRELLAYVRDAVENLPDRLRRVVIGYFIEERSMADIAEELGVTESRVSHIRSEALSLMGEAIRKATEDAPEPASDERLGVALRRRAAFCASVAAASDYRSRLATASAWHGEPGGIAVTA